MANTVIELRRSHVSGNVPISLANGEIAINTYDGKLFYRGGVSNTVQTIERFTGPAGLNQEIQFNDSGVLGANSGLTYNKSTGALTVSGNLIVDTNTLYVDAANNEVGIGTTTPGYKLEVNGSFAAITKSFVITHPTKDGMKLRYGSLEGPENGVYIRGRTKKNIIELPEYWTKLVDSESITVNLTPIGSHQNLFVEKIKDNKIYIKSNNVLNKSIDCFYIVFAERIDVDKLKVEYAV